MRFAEIVGKLEQVDPVAGNHHAAVRAVRKIEGPEGLALRIHRVETAFRGSLLRIRDIDRVVGPRFRVGDVALSGRLQVSVAPVI